MEIFFSPRRFEPFGKGEVLSAFNHLDHWRLGMIREWLSQQPELFEGLGIEELLSRNGVSINSESGMSLEGGGSSSARDLVANSLLPVPPASDPIISFILFVATNPQTGKINGWRISVALSSISCFLALQRLP